MGLETDRKEWHKDLECWYQVWGLGIRVSRFGLSGFIGPYRNVASWALLET